MKINHGRQSAGNWGKRKPSELVGLSFALSAFVLIATTSCASWGLLRRPPEEVLRPRPKQERTVVSNTLPLQVKWKYKLDLLLGSPLSAEDGRIIVWQANILSAIDAETGQEEWNLHSEDDFDFVTAVGQDSIAYSHPMLPHGEISVLNAATGQLRWKKQIDTVYTFAIGDGHLYVGWAQHAGAYDLHDGASRWEMTERFPTHTVIVVYYDAGKVYVIEEYRLFVLNAEDGRLLRSFDYPETRMEVVAQETVYGAAWPNVLAIDALTGATRWTSRASPLKGYVRPTLLGGTLYVVTQDGQLVALDANTGEQKWIAENVQRAFSNVIEFNGIGYVLSKDGLLHGFDIESGRQIGVFTTSPDIAARFDSQPAIPSLAVVGKTMAVTFGDSYVYGFEASAP